MIRSRAREESLNCFKSDDDQGAVEWYPIDKTAGSIYVKNTGAVVGETLSMSLTRFVIDVARLSDFKRQCDKYCVGESLGETSCSRRKADGIFLKKLDLSDETIVGVGLMRTTADIVCYSGVICACEKGENLGSSPVPFKKTNMCSIPQDQIVLNAMIIAWDKSMSWIMTFHC